MAPLKRLQKAELARWRQLKEKWDAEDKKTRGPEPVPYSYILNDATIEACGQLLAKNEQGTLLERDELSGWFGAMDKYSGVRGSAADRAFWLAAWNGVDYTVNRVSRPSLYIPNLSIAILGGIQPDAIRRVVAETIDDGLLQRLIPITVGSAGIREDTPDYGNSFEAYDDLVARLVALPRQVIKFTAEAQEVRRDFAQYSHELANLEVLSPQLAAFCGKLNALFPRLALAMHCCENSRSLPEHIPEEITQRVDHLLREFIIPHALRFYLGIADETGTMAAARNIAGYILAKQKERLTFGALVTDCWPCRKRSRAEVIEMLEPLEMFGWIERDDPVIPRAWTVNPAVHQQFADHAEQERERREHIRGLIIEK